MQEKVTMINGRRVLDEDAIATNTNQRG